MGRTWIIGVAAVLTTVAVSGVGGTASAKPLEHGDFHDEFSELVPDFCDSPGLTVQINGVVDGKFLVNARGRDDLVYFQEHVRVSVMYTNVNNGKFVTSRRAVCEQGFESRRQRRWHADDHRARNG